MSNAKQARNSLVEQALNEVRTIPKYSNFFLHTYYVIAKLGLQRKAKEEGLLETEDWNKEECKDALFERIKQFLIKYIR